MVNDKNFQALITENESTLHEIVNHEKRPPTANNECQVKKVTPPQEASVEDVERDVKYVVTKIKITLMSNWGQRQLIGLAGRFNRCLTFILYKLLYVVSPAIVKVYSIVCYRKKYQEYGTILYWKKKIA